jgi:Leucine-rich repeat (LRR) protein
MTLNNEIGWDGFTMIDGVHSVGKTNIDVKVVTRDAGVTLIIPKIVCQKFTNLKRMNFENFGITKLTIGSFENCRFLDELNFNNNKISTIDWNTFSSPTKLTKLYLNLNEISSLTSQFSYLTNLVSLTLDNNTNLQLSSSVFSQLNNLKTLSMRSCSLDVWHFDWFRNLERIQSIDLDNNFIAEIPLPNVFHSKALLQRFSIANNRIRTLERASFGDLSSLKDLIFRNNLLQNVDKRIFENAKILINAWFTGNLCIGRDITNFYNDRTGNMNLFGNCNQMFSQFPMSKFKCSMKR